MNIDPEEVTKRIDAITENGSQLQMLALIAKLLTAIFLELYELRKSRNVSLRVE